MQNIVWSRAYVCLIQNFLWIFIEEKFPFPKCCHVLRLCSRTLLRVSAMTTTTRFPLFKASIVNPAVGKGAGWIRSEILIIFLFFTSLIGLLRAEINWFQWDDRVMNDGDADHLCSNWSSTRILQIESIFHHIVDGHWSLHIQSQWFHYNFPLVLACTANLENTPHFLKNVTPSEKRSPWPPKKWKLSPFFFCSFRIHLGMDFLQKTGSNLVYLGLWSLISDLHTPIGGSHRVLYFTTQLTEKYSTAMCYSRTYPCNIITLLNRI